MGENISVEKVAQLANQVGLVVTNLPKRKMDGVEIPHSVDWSKAHQFANLVLKCSREQDVSPVVNNGLPSGVEFQPIETIEYWLNAYSDPASGEHFLGHGMVVALLGEYLALRQHCEMRSGRA